MFNKIFGKKKKNEFKSAKDCIDRIEKVYREVDRLNMDLMLKADDLLQKVKISTY